MVIYKYQLFSLGELHVPMPQGAKMLHVGVQDGCITLWALVDTEAPIVHHVFQVVGTGWSVAIQPEWDHVGTVDVDGLVWHVFYKGVKA